MYLHRRFDSGGGVMMHQRELTPTEIVKWLDKHVIGQENAKRSVAIALRNRFRRRNVPEHMRKEIYPSNLIMMGPTGIGKTEIARRLASLTESPFVKVEATKFTETGYVGRDVESMVRGLVRVAMNMTANKNQAGRDDEVDAAVEKRLIKALKVSGYSGNTDEEIRRMLKRGTLEEAEIDLIVSETAPQMGIFPVMPGGGSFDGPMGENIQGMMEKMLGGRRKARKMKVSDAREFLREEEFKRLLDGTDHIREGLELAQEYGIIFIDEIDKIIGIEGGKGPDVSRMGVQRDLLPIVEGSTIHTRYGPIKTDHILFIAAGAFNGSSPSDLIPELQGRFPMRTTLNPLDEDALLRILTEPEHSLLKQYTSLLKADGINLKLTKGALREVAQVTSFLNEITEDIGARRLRPVLSYLLDEQFFGAPDIVSGSVRISGKEAKSILSGLADAREDSNYIL